MWNQLALETKICVLINYASVFNDVIEIEELIKRINPDKRQEINSEIDRLKKEGRIYVEHGFAAVNNLKFKIKNKKEDFRITHELLSKRLKALTKFSFLPTIKFIGISGSLAAKNPVISSERDLDIDIFIITSRHSIWLTGLVVRTYSRIADNITHKRAGRLCFNHVWDSMDLKVYNPNFYIATEIYNMIPVYGELHEFLEANKWIYEYYPTLKLSVRKDKKLFRSGGLPFLNGFFFFTVTLLRCFKNFSLRPLRDLTGDATNLNSVSLKRYGAENGGYQNMVRLRFLENLKNNFPNLKTDKIDQILFPDSLSSELRTTPDYKLFSRLNKQSQHDWKINQRKYTYPDSNLK